MLKVTYNCHSFATEHLHWTQGRIKCHVRENVDNGNQDARDTNSLWQIPKNQNKSGKKQMRSKPCSSEHVELKIKYINKKNIYINNIIIKNI